MQACAESGRRVTVEWRIVEFDVGPAFMFVYLDISLSKELRVA